MMTPTYTIALGEAFLCSDCDRIGQSAVRCPSCASEHGLTPLASFLNRESDADMAVRILAAIEKLDTVLQ